MSAAAATLLCGCAGDDAAAPAQAANQVHAAFGSTETIAVTGIADPPAVDTDQRPVYALFAGERALDIDAVDAAVDADTGTLVWIDDRAAMWAAPLATAPDGARQLATDAIPGLATSRGRVAYAVSVDGPETAPYVIDLRTGARAPLPDGPGPDEVLAFSPAGDEVLVLSGRTGLASLFALATDATQARQLTNVGLAPGPGLEVDRVAPTPIDRRAVAWGPRGVAYRAAQAVIRVEPDGALSRLSSDAPVAEVVR